MKELDFEKKNEEFGPKKKVIYSILLLKKVRVNLIKINRLLQREREKKRST